MFHVKHCWFVHPRDIPVTPTDFDCPLGGTLERLSQALSQLATGGIYVGTA